ncbi:hypothetical protein ABZ464_29360 [Streptomyces sp. NPDC005820]|uniref:hypothetical protein n=1 Tax=Streptomyces sp. NPDC005820 TaxID=3157069 RepID=UPI00340FC749
MRAGEGGFTHRPAHALPTYTWDHVSGITLLGDAAHLMPPSDVGANLVLLDGADLAQALVTEDTIDEAVRAYEVMMRRHWAAAAHSAAQAMARLLPDPACRRWPS